MTRKWAYLSMQLARPEWNPLDVRDAILESSLTRDEKLVLTAIVSHVSAKEPQPSPGVRRLATLASVRRDTVTRTIARLEQRGLVRLVGGRAQRKAHRYDLTSLKFALLAVPPTGTEDGESVPIGSTAAVPIGSTAVLKQSTESVPIGSTEPDDLCSQTGQICAPKPARSVLPNRPDLSRSGAQKQVEANLEAGREREAEAEAEADTPSPPPKVQKIRGQEYEPTNEQRERAWQRGVNLEASVAAFRAKRAETFVSTYDFDAWLEREWPEKRDSAGRIQTLMDRADRLRAEEQREGKPPGLAEHERIKAGYQSAEEKELRNAALSGRYGTKAQQRAVAGTLDLVSFRAWKEKCDAERAAAGGTA